MLFIVDAETAAKVDEMKIRESSPSQPASDTQQHRQTLSAAYQHQLYQQSLALRLPKKKKKRSCFQVCLFVCWNVQNVINRFWLFFIHYISRRSTTGLFTGCS